MRGGLLGGVTVGDVPACLLSATQAVRRYRCKPIGQDREGLPAWLTDSPADPDALSVLIVGGTEPSPMADDRVPPAHRTTPRHKLPWDHPGSTLSFASGSAIKRITAGVKARR